MFGVGKRKSVEVPVQQEREQEQGGLQYVDEEQGQSMQTDCAWCLAEAGIAPASGSHGICASHSEQMIASSRQRKARRQLF